jgi:two-component sensor histidine kinase
MARTAKSEEPAMTQSEVNLELTPGLDASGTARAAITEEFGDLGEDRLVDLRLAVASLVTNSVRAQREAPIQVHIWMNADEQVRGEVADDGSGAESLRRRQRNPDGSQLRVLDAVTSDWGTSEDLTWFVV